MFIRTGVAKRQRRGLRKRENYESLLEAKGDYLDELREHIDYLGVLAKGERVFEATILASCYLDALGRLRYTDSLPGSQQRFIQFLLSYGGDRRLAWVSLPILARNLREFEASETTDLRAWIQAKVSRKQTFSTEQTLLHKFGARFKKPEKFAKEIRKATVAGAIYTAVRSRGVHEMSSLSNRKTIEMGNGKVVITGTTVIGLVSSAFTAVRPYLERTHRWARLGKYA